MLTYWIQGFRHFADWSLSSPEYNILKEIERGFTETFLSVISDEKMGIVLFLFKKIYMFYYVFSSGYIVNEIPYLTKEGWLQKWSELLNGSGILSDFPVWLQFFVKVLFQVINRSGMYILKICCIIIKTKVVLLNKYADSIPYNILCINIIQGVHFKLLRNLKN